MEDSEARLHLWIELRTKLARRTWRIRKTSSSMKRLRRMAPLHIASLMKGRQSTPKIVNWNNASRVQVSPTPPSRSMCQLMQPFQLLQYRHLSLANWNLNTDKPSRSSKKKRNTTLCHRLPRILQRDQGHFTEAHWHHLTLFVVVNQVS